MWVEAASDDAEVIRCHGLTTAALCRIFSVIDQPSDGELRLISVVVQSGAVIGSGPAPFLDKKTFEIRPGQRSQ